MADKSSDNLVKKTKLVLTENNGCDINVFVHKEILLGTNSEANSEKYLLTENIDLHENVIL